MRLEPREPNLEKRMLPNNDPFEKEIKTLACLTYGLILLSVIVYIAKLLVDHPF